MYKEKHNIAGKEGDFEPYFDSQAANKTDRYPLQDTVSVVMEKTETRLLWIIGEYGE